jgi:hypothetical protein
MERSRCVKRLHTQVGIRNPSLGPVGTERENVLHGPFESRPCSATEQSLAHLGHIGRLDCQIPGQLGAQLALELNDLGTVEPADGDGGPSIRRVRAVIEEFVREHHAPEEDLEVRLGAAAGLWVLLLQPPDEDHGGEQNGLGRARFLHGVNHEGGEICKKIGGLVVRLGHVSEEMLNVLDTPRDEVLFLAELCLRL